MSLSLSLSMVGPGAKCDNAANARSSAVHTAGCMKETALYGGARDVEIDFVLIPIFFSLWLTVGLRVC